MNAKRRMGNHTNLLKTEQHLISEKILRKHTVGKGRHKPTFLEQPAITIPKHEHWMNTREERSMQNQYELIQTELIQKWIKIDTIKPTT